MYSYENVKSSDSKRVREPISVKGSADTELISNRFQMYQGVVQTKSMDSETLHDRLAERINSHILQSNACVQRRGHKREFQGTEDVPVIFINERRVTALLEAYGTRQARNIIDAGFIILAGIHRGGTGGAAGSPDPRPHITIRSGNTVYHLRLTNDYSRIVEITP